MLSPLPLAAPILLAVAVVVAIPPGLGILPVRLVRRGSAP
jgi:hypothetical protein